MAIGEDALVVQAPGRIGFAFPGTVLAACAADRGGVEVQGGTSVEFLAVEQLRGLLQFGVDQLLASFG